MGYITTISIYNDGADSIEKNAEDFAKKVADACLGVHTRDMRFNSIGCGSHANLITVQKPRHADDKTIYVHAGNTVIEMNPYSKKTQDILERVPTFFDELLDEMESKVKALKEMKAKHEKNKA